MLYLSTAIVNCRFLQLENQDLTKVGRDCKQRRYKWDAKRGMLVSDSTSNPCTKYSLKSHGKRSKAFSWLLVTFKSSNNNSISGEIKSSLFRWAI
jgi:hypothetical protein